MQILNKDLKKGQIEFYIDNLDDLWVLNNIIEKEDTIICLTYRREEKRDDLLRAERGEKRPMVLSIAVEDINYHDFSDWLRVHGIIQEGAQGIGSYHTLNLEVGQRVTVGKASWKPFHLQEINNAVKRTKQPNVILISIEDDNATIAILHQYGIQRVAVIDRQGTGKQYQTPKHSKTEYMKEIFDTLTTILPKDQSAPPIMILGPGFAKEDLKKYISQTNQDLVTDLYIENTGHAGMTGVHEALKRGLIGKILSDNRVENETQLVESFITRIAKNEPVAYGKDEIRSALTMGAVETLLVTDQIVRETETSEFYDMATTINATVHIISTGHEAGKKLAALGGLGAFLRFKIR